MSDSTRRPVIAANWKMQKTIGEAREFCDAFLPELGADPGPEVVLCPPFLAVNEVVAACEGAPVTVATQNMYFEESGAFTGEVSPAMLLDAGVGAAVIGHSERRQLFGETDEALSRKVPAALEAGIQPILCCGETEAERESDDTDAVLSHQVITDLAEVHTDDLDKVVIAYEPIWAIGTGKTASLEQAQEAIHFIRNLLRSRDPEGAQRVRILYGGSVKPGNAAELMAQPDIDGALVGGASLDPEDFGGIVSAASGA